MDSRRNVSNKLSSAVEQLNAITARHHFFKPPQDLAIEFNQSVDQLASAIRESKDDLDIDKINKFLDTLSSVIQANAIAKYIIMSVFAIVGYGIGAVIDSFNKNCELCISETPEYKLPSSILVAGMGVAVAQFNSTTLTIKDSGLYYKDIHQQIENAIQEHDAHLSLRSRK